MNGRLPESETDPDPRPILFLFPDGWPKSLMTCCVRWQWLQRVAAQLWPLKFHSDVKENKTKTWAWELKQKLQMIMALFCEWLIQELTPSFSSGRESGGGGVGFFERSLSVPWRLQTSNLFKNIIRLLYMCCYIKETWKMEFFVVAWE